MIDRIPFSARARTIDHLGREQIADCPTAISELWKNSYDAYARNVALHVFDGVMPVSAVFDDGHGMSLSEFEEKWLVVGTEFKKTNLETAPEDRLGLPSRIRQGEKGIGRLSCAALGKLALVVSKRKGKPFVASLIDWRLFENPYLMLSDVSLPVVEFGAPEDFWAELPLMYDALIENIWGTEDDLARKERLNHAWNSFDELEQSQGIDSTTRQKIEETVINAVFDERHMAAWAVWAGDTKCGTALLSADISYDLESLLTSHDTAEQDPTFSAARERVFRTLSGFTDPYIKDGTSKDEFHYRVEVWRGERQSIFLSEDRDFDETNFQKLEHIVEGVVDGAGIFRGRVKVFGEWDEEEVEIRPARQVPGGPRTKVGGFRLKIGAYEGVRENSALTDEDHVFIQKASENYSGLFLYRDGLRVLPFGRPDNDFFEIEKRRSQSVGREFWSHRRMFGSIEISSIGNANLVDKAGREGLIDNRSAKAFSDLVEGILMASARRFFGSGSELRKPRLEVIREEKRQKRQKEQERELRQKHRKAFREKVEKQSKTLKTMMGGLADLHIRVNECLETPRVTSLQEMKAELGRVETNLHALDVGTLPQGMENFEAEYREYTSISWNIGSKLEKMTASIVVAIAELASGDQDTIWLAEVEAKAKEISILSASSIKELQGVQDEAWKRIRLFGDDSVNRFRESADTLRKDAQTNKRSLGADLMSLQEAYLDIHTEVEQFYHGAKSTFEAVRDNLNLNLLAEGGLDEQSKLREELSRINALAQLGITVEIIGHELETLDTTVTRGLKALEHSTKQTMTYKRTVEAHKALTDRLRFLSPLKLSGNKSKEWITGRDIHRDVKVFFGKAFVTEEIEFSATSNFLDTKIFDRQSRIIPVFINLLNNSRYWIAQKKEKGGRIVLDLQDDKVIVGDDGPGIDKYDVESLFTLFFTRKPRGGRGVGLYLCRANLAAGGHEIYYAKSESERILSGANFVITFAGLEHA